MFTANVPSTLGVKITRDDAGHSGLAGSAEVAGSRVHVFDGLNVEAAGPGPRLQVSVPNGGIRGPVSWSRTYGRQLTGLFTITRAVSGANTKGSGVQSGQSINTSAMRRTRNDVATGGAKKGDPAGGLYVAVSVWRLRMWYGV